MLIECTTSHIYDSEDLYGVVDMQGIKLIGSLSGERHSWHESPNGWMRNTRKWMSFLPFRHKRKTVVLLEFKKA